METHIVNDKDNDDDDDDDNAADDDGGDVRAREINILDNETICMAFKGP